MLDRDSVAWSPVPEQIIDYITNAETCYFSQPDSPKDDCGLFGSNIYEKKMVPY